MNVSLNPNRFDGLHCGFAVDSRGECTELVASHQVSAAYDMLTDAGYSPEKSASIATIAEQQGLNPEGIARKMASFRRILNEDSNQV